MHVHYSRAAVYAIIDLRARGAILFYNIVFDLKITITRAVEGEHLWIFESPSVSTHTYTTTKHWGFQHLEIILKFFNARIQRLSMENAKIAITRAVEGEHLWSFGSLSVSIRTYTTTKHRDVQNLEIILKFFSFAQCVYTGAQYGECKNRHN